jgi:hypothetical protein
MNDTTQEKPQRYSISRLSYADAIALIEALSAIGIESNITAGGVAIYPLSSQVEAMQACCMKFGERAFEGTTILEDNVLYPWSN